MGNIGTIYKTKFDFTYICVCVCVKYIRYIHIYVWMYVRIYVCIYVYIVYILYILPLMSLFKDILYNKSYEEKYKRIFLLYKHISKLIKNKHKSQIL